MIVQVFMKFFVLLSTALLMASAIPITHIPGRSISLTEDMGFGGYAHYSECQTRCIEVG
jgi:hypothetical protein